MSDSKNLSVVGPLANNSITKSVLFWISLSVLIGLGCLLVLFFKEGSGMELTVIGLSIVPIFFAVELNRRNNTQVAGTIIAIVLTVMVTVLATLGQGIYDIAVMSYPAILIFASLILGRNNSIYLALLLIICVGWLIFGDIYGLYQSAFPEQSYPRQFYIASIILIVTAVAVQFLSETMRNNVVAIRRELEERKKAERALQEAKELYRNMVEETSVITYRDTAERESKTVYISPQIENILGYSQQEWLENPSLWAKLTHPDDLPDVYTKISEYLETGNKGLSEYRMLSKDGRWVWFQDESVVVKNSSGEALYIHGVLIDIIERKKAELKLKQREAILSAVAQTAQQLLKTSNWRDKIDGILQMLGEATGASHVYIFENHPGKDGVMLSSIKYEWTALGMKPELLNPIYQDTRLIPTVQGFEDCYANLNIGWAFN